MISSAKQTASPTYTRANGIELRAFVDILNRLVATGELGADSADASEDDWSRYLATHPPTNERAELFRADE